MNKNIYTQPTIILIISFSQLYPASGSWFLPKNTPYTAEVSAALQRLFEAGITTKLYRDYMEEEEKQEVRSSWRRRKSRR